MFGLQRRPVLMEITDLFHSSESLHRERRDQRQACLYSHLDQTGEDRISLSLLS